jgi:hypothetical protein
VLIPHLFVIFGHQDIVLNWFNTDDAFYYFKTAQNVVEGGGFTFDGIARSNGFHPLWMILMLPIFTLAKLDLLLPLRLVIALQVALGVGSTLLIFRFCRERCANWPAFVTALVWAFTPIIYKVVFKGGTEAGLNAFFLVLLWWQYYRVSEAISQGKVKFGRIVALGVLALLTLLSRLDNAYLVWIAGGWLLLRFWRQPGAESVTLLSTFKWWLKLGITYFTPLVITLGSYLLINQLYFGSAMPVSGKVKRWWGTLPFTAYGKPPQSIKQFFQEFFSSKQTVGPWAMVMSPVQRISDLYYTLGWSGRLLFVSLLILLAGLLIFSIIRNRKFFVDTFWRWNLIPLLAGCLVQIVYYKAFGHIAQRGWYWVAEMLLVILLLGITLEILTREAQKLPGGKKLVAAGSLVLMVSLALPYLKIPYQVIVYQPSEEAHFYLRRANFLEENTEPGALIGMTGSGSSGYFVRDRVVVNLDGLINSQEYFVHLQNATADDYLEAIGVDYVFGNPYILQNTNPYQWNFDNRLEEYRYLEVGDKTLVLFKFR